MAAALALPEDFDGDRFDRVRRSHAAYFCAVSAAIVLVGIFINVMPNLEMGALGAAVTKLKDIFNQAGVDAGKAFDTVTSVLRRRVE